MPGPRVDKRNAWAMAVHLSALTVFLAIPLANLIFPWALARWKGTRWPEVAAAGVEALNFQLTASLCALASLGVGMVIPLLGWLGILVAGLGTIYLTCIAADRSRSGQSYRYPLSIRFFRSLPFSSPKPPMPPPADAA